MLAPAILVERAPADIAREGAGLHAVFDDAVAPAERAARRLRASALEIEAVLHFHRQGAAERVEAEYGIVADQIDPVHGKVRHQVPVDGVAERLVDAHAVLIDREALRRALDRRGVEAAILDVRLKRAVLNVIDVDAGHALAERAGEAGRPVTTEIAG